MRRVFQEFGRTNYSWLGALPDIFRKNSVRNFKVLRDSLGGITKDDFILETASSNCSEKVANAKCATFVSKC